MKTIPLTKGLVAVIDDADYELVSEYSWYASQPKKRINKWYARAHVKGSHPPKRIYLHRLIMGFPRNQVDHKNGDSLNCQKENLRVATNQQNSFNSRRKGHLHRFRGITKRAKGYGCTRDTWIAQIKVNYKTIHLGVFHSEVEAAKAYDVAALNHFGEFAQTNFKWKRGPRGKRKTWQLREEVL